MTPPDSTPPPASETPESDSESGCDWTPGSVELVPTDLARRLEKERNEARQSLTTANADREAMQKERDEWHKTATEHLQDSVKLTAGFNEEIATLRGEAEKNLSLEIGDEFMEKHSQLLRELEITKNQRDEALARCSSEWALAIERDTALATIESLTAKLKEAEAGWQPIETAPKDGTEVLLCVKLRAGIQRGRLVGHYMPGGHCIEDYPAINRGWYFWNGRMFDEASEPTHWMPLPVIDAAMKGANQ